MASTGLGDLWEGVGVVIKCQEWHPVLMATGVLPSTGGNIMKNILGKKDSEWTQ